MVIARLIGGALICGATVITANADSFVERWPSYQRATIADADVPVRGRAGVSMSPREEVTTPKRAAACKPHRERVKVYRRNGKSWRYIRRWKRC